MDLLCEGRVHDHADGYDRDKVVQIKSRGTVEKNWSLFQGFKSRLTRSSAGCDTYLEVAAQKHLRRNFFYDKATDKKYYDDVKKVDVGVDRPFVR